MHELPYRQHYPGDFMRETRGWPLSAKGLLIELLDAQWDRVTLPVDPAELQAIVGASDAEWAIAWPRCESAFPITEGARRNMHLHEQRRGAVHGRAKFIERSRLALAARAKKRAARAAKLEARRAKRAINKGVKAPRGNGPSQGHLQDDLQAHLKDEPSTSSSSSSSSSPSTNTGHHPVVVSSDPPGRARDPATAGKPSARAVALMSTHKNRDWNRVKRDYPESPWGSRPGVDAAIEWIARRDEGHTGAEMLEGMYRYKAWLQATTGRKLYYRPERFFGHEKFFGKPWNPELSKADALLAGNLAAAERAARK